MPNKVPPELDISVLQIKVARLLGPQNLIANWLEQPELSLTIPGIKVNQSLHSKILPYNITFHSGSKRRIVWTDSERTLGVAGDIESFQAKDFRRLFIHIAKVELSKNLYHYVHAACVVDASGRGLLLCGGAGSGKTTLALYLTQMGYKLVSTDITLIDCSCRAWAGTQYVNIYPSLMIKWFPKYSHSLSTDSVSVDDFSKKQRIPQRILNSEDIFNDRKGPVRIDKVYYLSLRNEERLPYCQSMRHHQKLKYSLLLNEDWATSSWLSPSWLEFFPIINDRTAVNNRHVTAINLADLHHFFLTGDIDYCAMKIDNLTKNG